MQLNRASIVSVGVCVFVQQSTDEYEHGAYKHFDYEQWKEQERKNFTFEYQFLEDDLPSQ